MGDFVIAINYEKCTGCRTCELVCSTKNYGVTDPEKSRIRCVKLHKEADLFPIPVVCMKCTTPACKAVCPQSAISDDPTTGARIIDERKCIGCSACVYACPFGVIAVDRTLKHAYTCNQCEGDPTCVQFCETKAIQYLESSEVSITLRRNRMKKYIDFINTDPEIVDIEH